MEDQATDEVQLVVGVTGGTNMTVRCDFGVGDPSSVVTVEALHTPFTETPTDV